MVVHHKRAIDCEHVYNKGDICKSLVSTKGDF